MNLLRFASLSLAIVLSGLSGVASAQWGNLKGQFVLDGAIPAPKEIQVPGNIPVKGKIFDESLVVGEKGGIANIVIYVRTKDVKVHPDYAKTEKDSVKYDNINFQFKPHVAVLRLSQTLEVANSDPQSHNSNFQPLGDEGINPLLTPGQSVKYTANRPQTIPQKVSCNIHPWMGGYILFRPDPYATVTDKEGNFELKNLPTGELEFQIWHEKAGYLVADPKWDKGRVTLTIKAGDNTLGNGPIKVPAKLFDK